MFPLSHLIQQNREWSSNVQAITPNFFSQLSKQHAPEYFWIGCADSRVPANEIVGLAPGEIFVHRNVANVVVHSDLNCLSCIQFAVEVLRVKHIIVCGHYGCGGITAVYKSKRLGLIDNWLRHVKDVQQKHAPSLEELPPEERLNRLCEYNVIEQVNHVAQTTVVMGAWEKGQTLSVHGWIYSLEDGIVKDLKVTETSIPPTT
jgi:carbonic anhydrase